MKKLLTIFIALAYFAVSSGVMVNMHYCMGKLYGVSYHASTTNHCNKCGMDGSGCCKDDMQVIKLADAQNTVPAIHFELPSLQPLIVTHSIADWALHNFNNNKDLSTGIPPDNVTLVSRNILHCVFRV
ncbi:MAG: hypothetical protein QM802_24335 [Agriterribacter sp.]